MIYIFPRVFNKETIINFLIQKKSSPESVNALFSEYIRNLKDVKELKLTPNPAYKDGAEKAGQAQKEAQFICPITGLEMNGCYRFIYLWTCGCVFSERGLKQIKDGVCVEVSYCRRRCCRDDDEGNYILLILIIINRTVQSDLHGRRHNPLKSHGGRDGRIERQDEGKKSQEWNRELLSLPLIDDIINLPVNLHKNRS